MATDVNVRVAVRCRPMNSRETQLNSRSIVRVVDGSTIFLDEEHAPGTSTGSTSHAPRQFTFDHAYGEGSTQDEVYQALAMPLVEKALQGYNGTIFAYGQTGSGKTHTMLGGVNDSPGLLPLMYQDLFKRVAQCQEEARGEEGDQGLDFQITVSFLEIYNEVLKDLLNPSDRVLKIREHPNLGIYVEPLAELVVHGPADVQRLLEQGNKVRQVAATQMNERSSRSHTCFTIKVASKRSQEVCGVMKDTCMTAKLNLVDLAGSERASKTGATGDRLKEGASINKSLSALGNVINMLAEKPAGGSPTKGKNAMHVPYRDSKLTRLLQESLGGNALTVMVAAISPAEDNIDETLSTLQYAHRAKSIKNATKKNEDVNERIIRELREEIEKLRQMVRPDTSSSVLDTSSSGEAPTEAMGKMEETIANLEKAKQQSWEEKERLTKLYEEERAKSLANETKILSFMQTVKQEKLENMKRAKSLQQKRVQLSKKLKTVKVNYAAHKTELQEKVESFQLNPALSAHEKTVLVKSIEVAKQVVLADRDELVQVKDELKECEESIADLEAEAAAANGLLEEDEKLRKAIQEDEREKMKQERAAYLEQALEEEKKKLQGAAEEEKQQLRVALEATADKEQKLAEEVEAQRARAVELQQQLFRMKTEHIEWRRDVREKMVQHVEAVKAEFLKEKQHMDDKYAHAIKLLRLARDDIVELGRQNERLEKENRKMLYWDKPFG